MGFPRADIDRAMRAAFFNPDRAVEYLLNVIVSGIRDQSTTNVHCRGYQRTSSKNNSKQLKPRLLLAQPLRHAKEHPLHPPHKLPQLLQATLATNLSTCSRPPHKQAVVAPAADVPNDKVLRPLLVSSAKDSGSEQALELEAKLAQVG